MNVQQIIKEKGWTVTKVAEEMGIKQVTLSQNLARNPTVKTLRRIANIIGCNVGDFFRDEQKKENLPSITMKIDGKQYDVELKSKK